MTERWIIALTLFLVTHFVGFLWGGATVITILKNVVSELKDMKIQMEKNFDKRDADLLRERVETANRVNEMDRRFEGRIVRLHERVDRHGEEITRITATCKGCDQHKENRNQ